MKRVLFLSLIMVLALESCWAAGAGRSGGKPEGELVINPHELQQIQAAVQAPAVVQPQNPMKPKFEPQLKVEILKVEKPQVTYFGKDKIPAAYREITILGTGVISQEQALRYVQANARNPRLNCSVTELVNAYYEEASLEGVRPDVALCQALLETGMFTFTGTVHPDQNNFCGLGTTGKGVKGARFATAREGVRAHIQHLLAYCRKEEPRSKVVDPRYSLVHQIRMGKGLITKWFGLNGTWAMGANYCEKVMAIYMDMME